MRRPSRSPWPSRVAWAVIGVGAVFFAVVVVRTIERHDALTRWRHSLEVAAGRPPWPEWSPAWPALPAPPQGRHRLPPELHGAYAYAARNKEVLQHIPCYCGCAGEGHRDNFSCFVSGSRPDGTPVWTDHSFGCPMCVHIARETMLMSSQGMSVQRIRQEIENHYKALGEPTNTSEPNNVGGALER